MAARRAALQKSADWLRTSLVTEPRGSECMVGAILQKPVSPQAAAGVIFFNNVGYLGMCGHGLIGVAATLAHLGRIGPGTHAFETPVGDVTVRLGEDGAVSFDNVCSYRHLKERCRRRSAIGTRRGRRGVGRELVLFHEYRPAIAFGGRRGIDRN